MRGFRMVDYIVCNHPVALQCSAVLSADEVWIGKMLNVAAVSLPHSFCL